MSDRPTAPAPENGAAVLVWFVVWLGAIAGVSYAGGWVAGFLAVLASVIALGLAVAAGFTPPPPTQRP